MSQGGLMKSYKYYNIVCLLFILSFFFKDICISSDFIKISFSKKNEGIYKISQKYILVNFRTIVDFNPNNYGISQYKPLNSKDIEILGYLDSSREVIYEKLSNYNEFELINNDHIQNVLPLLYSAYVYESDIKSLSDYIILLENKLRVSVKDDRLLYRYKSKYQFKKITDITHTIKVIELSKNSPLNAFEISEKFSKNSLINYAYPLILTYEGQEFNRLTDKANQTKLIKESIIVSKKLKKPNNAQEQNPIIFKIQFISKNPVSKTFAVKVGRIIYRINGKVNLISRADNDFKKFVKKHSGKKDIIIDSITDNNQNILQIKESLLKLLEKSKISYQNGIQRKENIIFIHVLKTQETASSESLELTQTKSDSSELTSSKSEGYSLTSNIMESSDLTSVNSVPSDLTPGQTESSDITPKQ